MSPRVRAAALGAFAISALLVAQHPALAQLGTEQLEGVASVAGIPTANVAVMIARVIRVFLGTLGVIFTILVIYAGFIFLTAQGDADKVKRGRTLLKNGVIGMLLCVTSFSIASYILGKLLAGAGAGGGTSATADQYSEPLSGSLGAGIVESHYPERNAVDIPRNTRVMVTFKQPVDPGSIIEGYENDPSAVELNADNVKIYPTEEGDGAALGASDVLVTTNADHTIYVFDPVPLLGDGVEDVNYTVGLSSDILLESGADAFSGAFADGYEWTFEISTEVDLTPPQVVSVVPGSGDEEARNVTVSITFSEAMDPVASTGSFAAGASGNFTNLEAKTDGENVAGTFAISNAYRTVEFTPEDACGEDPCGDTIYCLPGDETVMVEAHAASLSSEPPQAELLGVSFDGLVDAAGNSLDGDGDDEAQGSASDAVEGTDDYAWSFNTTDDVNDTVPEISSIRPGILDTFADHDADVEITFSVPMKSSTLNSSNVSLWPDPWYEFWFTLSNDTGDPDGDGSADYTVAQIAHPTLVSADDLGWTYSPVVTRGVKSTYQICLFPALGPDADERGTCDVSEAFPYCCNGSPSDAACPTSIDQIDLPDTTE